MESVFILAVVAATSAAATWLGRRHRPLSRARLRAALTGAMHVLGWSMIFLLANVGVGLLAILVIRGVTRAFVSVYIVDDVSLIVLSVLQGLLAARVRAGSVDDPVERAHDGRAHDA